MNGDAVKPLVSVILPIHNGENWIDACFESIQKQTALNLIRLEISVCDDASSDKTSEMLEHWKRRFEAVAVSLKVFRNERREPGGVGYAKNKAVHNSSGEYLCFQDVDDIMLPCRIEAQYNVAKDNKNSIIGGNFQRIPVNATARFSHWANTITGEKLESQVYTSHGPTVIMPTWFCHRAVFERVGGFCESGRGCPEDLIFFYSHLDHGGKVMKVDIDVLIYVYHSDATTFSIFEKTIWDLRVERLKKRVLPAWDKFTIWNAGKQGRLLFRSLDKRLQEKVVAFCDVDRRKIGQNYVSYEPVQKEVGRPIPIIHFTEAKPPFIICVKMDMTNGDFENNLKSLDLKEGRDFVHFN